MRKLVITFLLIFSSCLIYSQNVGIGTTTPDHRFHVKVGGDKVKTYNYGLEYTTNTTGGWARGFRIRNENDDKSIVFGGLSGQAFIATGFDLAQHPTGYQFRRLVILENGNVGIGNGSPAAKLSVRSDTAARGLEVLSPHGNSHFPFSDGNSYIGGEQLIFRANGNSEKMRITSAGNIGIATTVPEHKFHVNTGAGKFKTYQTGVEYTVNTTGGWARGFRLRNENTTEATTFGALNGTAYISSNYDVTTSATGYQQRQFVLLPNGNVGIGSNNPTSKLAVNGDIRSREVLVETANWPDYVFQEEYNLPTLSEEENFINDNGHLSGFQSEEEMSNTITVGDVTKRQQEKIEQMMLHLIQMEKDMEAYKEKTDLKIDALKAENDKLKRNFNKKK